MLAGLFLLISWVVCWYFFFVRYRQYSHGNTRSSRLFVLTGVAVLIVLSVWSAAMWRVEPQVPAPPILALGVLLVLAGQWLMCAARRELPLSNVAVVARISTSRVQRGVYRYLSHPMYIGLGLALAGSSLVLGNKAALLIVLVLVPLLAARAVIEGIDDI